MSAPDAMDTSNVEEENRYGVASLDQLDDDDGPPTSAASASAAATAAMQQEEGASGPEGQPQSAAEEVESYALAVGVIEPPPELKIIIDRTADFVRRVGPQFESEILQRNKGKKQFQFLENPASPYHAYYKQRVKFGAEGPPPELVAAANKARGAGAEHAAEQAKQRAQAERKARGEEEGEGEGAAAKAKAPKALTLVERMRQYVESMHIADKDKVKEAEQEKKDKEAAATAAKADNGPAASPAQPSTSGHIHPSRAPPAGSAAATSAATPATGGSAASAAAVPFSFCLKQPEHYSAVDLDIIKLTALYLARCGQEFLHGLQRREQRNPYFDFIKPQHPLFVYFQHLVEAYTQVLIPRRGVKDALDAVVRRTTAEAYWKQLLVEAAIKKKRDAAAAAARAEEEADRNVLASIDWRDFVVVQSITFRDDEDAFLPAPCATVEQMAAMLAATDLNAADRLLLAHTNPQAAAAAIQEEDMDMDEGEEEGKPATTTGAKPAPTTTSTTATNTGAPREQDEVEQLIRSSVIIPDEEQLEIRTDAESAGAGGAKARAAVFQKCVVCGDEIAIDDLAEHMRIELLDPRWKEQKQALLDKQRESSLASDSIVSSNLARMARRVIGASDKEDQARAEIRARKQAAADAALLFGPHSQQAREAAARAGEILPPPPPPPKPAAAAAAPAAPIGPSMYQPPRASPPPPAAAPPSAAAAHIPVNRPLPPTSVPGAAAGGFGVQPPRPPMPAPGAIPPVPGMMRVAPFPAAPMPFNTAGAYGGAPVFPAPPPPAAPAAVASRPAPPIAADEQQAAKKQRVDSGAAVPAPAAPAPAAAAAAATAAAGKGGKQLLSEADFRAAHPPTVSLRVVVPSDAASPFAFAGQTLTLTAQLADSVGALKEQVSSLLGTASGAKQPLPANKMKLQFAAGGEGATAAGVYLNKDDATLAFYNVPNEATLSLGVKERGGQKKK